MLISRGFAVGKYALIALIWLVLTTVAPAGSAGPVQVNRTVPEVKAPNGGLLILSENGLPRKD